VLWKKSELLYLDLRAALGQELYAEDVFLNCQTEYGETIKAFVRYASSVLRCFVMRLNS
jgi:hypothetical protein